MNSTSNNVSALGAGVNATVEDVCAWLTAQGEAGHVTEAAAKNMRGAVQNFATVLLESEPRTAGYLYDNFDEVVERWYRKNPSTKRASFDTYRSRARRGLAAYLEWDRDPGKFKFDSPAPRGAATTSQTNGKKGAKRSRVRPEEAQAIAVPSAPQGPNWRTFELGEGRSIKFEVPGDLGMRDVARFFCHLMTLSPNFDPTDPRQGEFFTKALAAARGEE